MILEGEKMSNDGFFEMFWCANKKGQVMKAYCFVFKDDYFDSNWKKKIKMMKWKL